MDNTERLREVLKHPAREILAALPRMGRVMLATQSGGATHERLGEIEAIAFDGASARVSGAGHDGRIDVSKVARIVADRSVKMRDKVLPKIEAQDESGATLFSVHALDGLDLFDKALEPFGAGDAIEPAARAPGAPGSQEVPADDPGAAALRAVFDSGQTISIEMRRPGLVQAWNGALPEPRPAMGFVNIIIGDFHLHVKAGAIAGWRRLGDSEEVELVALDAGGAACGLVLRGAPAAFVGVGLAEAASA